MDQSKDEKQSFKEEEQIYGSHKCSENQFKHAKLSATERGFVCLTGPYKVHDLSVPGEALTDWSNIVWRKGL